jgi:hypothetical protein
MASDQIILISEMPEKCKKKIFSKKIVFVKENEVFWNIQNF